MKRLRPEVIINDGKYKGQKGILVGYDRNKWYSVYFPEKDIHEEFKFYYLDFLTPFKFKQRYLLLNQDTPTNVRRETNKDLAKSNKNDRKGISTKRRVFNLCAFDDNDTSFSDLNFSQLKSKIRYCITNNISFIVNITSYFSNGFISSPLVQFNAYDETSYTFFSHAKRTVKYYATFERGIDKVFSKY